MNRLLYTLFVGEFSWKRLLRSILLIPIAVYAGLLIMGWLIPDTLIFRPPAPSYPNGDDVIKISTSDGGTIAARFYENAGAEKVILFSHGNAEDLGMVEPFAQVLRDLGFSVLTYDYRGYGRSSGTPSEANSYGDIEAAYRYLTQARGYSHDNIIVHGRSLGGGPSVHLASSQPVGGLILESSFTSIARILFATRIFPFDYFDNLSKINAVKCPVLVIHGERDNTIPFSHGRQLYDTVKTAKKSFWVDAEHNDVFASARDPYVAAIISFSHDLTPP